jgi:hypothetical protein
MAKKRVVSKCSAKAAELLARAQKAEAALAEIRQLIAGNKLGPNYLLGMINEIAKHGAATGAGLRR